ncbi:hypothetical protein O1611_g4548 [Lasiodiplodia mahajangana]|uniref:Uncharacterized protein n=1 Tax=Lasiodiplodia mahajangana TaxID=1108764 RepID=A0ACC2JNP7_9PEZI|nr:hypothetical protein O1611_g4548 [Lasiodiplodia mahajangana]
MPHFRGIEVSIHASLEAKQVIEYPHPDGSSVCLMKAQAHPAIAEDVDPTRLKKVNPRISVYIPSLPGEQFWLRYLITQSPPPSRCIFFKMTMNGRHISSWGINVNTHSTGIVVRALYQPEDKWGDACGCNETGFPGIETRYFHFTPGLDNKSVAEDGGVIEVQVFRCKGRKRIALELDAYRNQERYGITSPSGGLVDNPEDATYYNYYLIDAKDAPYATFCFHYRSMKYLKQLNLVPQLGFDVSPVSKGSFDIQRERPGLTLGPEPTSPTVGHFTFDATSPDSRVFDNDVAAIGKDVVEHAETYPQDEYFLKSPPEILQSSLRGTLVKASSNTSEIDLLCEAQRRPLPEIPNAQTRPASASSSISLTPSLRQYVESEDFDNEDIRLSTAQHMLISSESMQRLELIDTGAEEGSSFSDYASSPSSTEPSHSPKLPSPAGYIPTTGSVLERHLTQYDSPSARSSPPITLNNTSGGAEGSLNNDQIECQLGVLKLTEGEWLRHTPSPLERNDEGTECSWSPLPEPCIEGAVGTLSDDAKGRVYHSHTIQRPVNIDEVNQAPVGNWI